MPRQSQIDAQRGSEVKSPAKAAIRERVAYESGRRTRLGVPAFAGGMLYLLGGITVSAALKALPTVGVIQAVAPALRGEPNPTVSPGAAEVRFIDHRAFGLIAGNVLQALAILVIVVVLLFLLGAVRFRRPEMSRAARLLVLAGGTVMVLVSVAHPAVQVLNARSFVSGHDFGVAAVSRALTESAPLEVTQYLGLLGGLALAAGMIVVMLGASRTGLLPRWLMILGIFMAVLAFTPFGLALGSAQQLIPAFWMVATGLLLMGRWPGGDPPAWAAGEARPWLPAGQARAEREDSAGGGPERAKGGGQRSRDSAQRSRGSVQQSKGSAQSKGSVQQSKDSAQHSNGDSSSVAPEPVQPASGHSTGKRRRKRGSRR